MKIGELASDLWDGFYGKRDFFAMRGGLREHFRQQGIKARIKNNETLVIDDCITVDFVPFENYAECKICYGCDAEDYVSLDNATKAFIAAGVNSDAESQGSHAMVYVYDDVFYVKTSFYFTRMKMMYELFFQHYEDLVDAVKSAEELISDAKKEEEQSLSQANKIGFCIQKEQDEKCAEVGQVAAKHQ